MADDPISDIKPLLELCWIKTRNTILFLALPINALFFALCSALTLFLPINVNMKDFKFKILLKFCANFL